MILSQKRPPLLLYIAIIVFCTIAMLTFTFPESLDITGYYEDAEIAVSSGVGLSEFVIFTIAKYMDFIYHTLLFVSLKNGIPLNLVSIIILSSYYIVIIEILRSHFSGIKLFFPVLFYTIISCPFVWALEVPRTLTAIIFLYLAIQMLLLGKNKIFVVLFVALSFFSHAGSSSIFIACLIVGMIFKKMDISKFTQIAILVGVFVIATLAPARIVNYAMELIGGMGNHYSVYSEVEIGGLFSYSEIGYGDRISSIMLFLYSCYLVFISKHKHTMYWLFYSLCVANAFFIMTNYSLLIRMTMFLPLFLAYNAIDVIKEQGVKKCRNLINLSMVGVAVVLLEFYFYRGLFHF